MNFILRLAPDDAEWSVYALYDEMSKARDDIKYLRENVIDVKYKLVREVK